MQARPGRNPRGIKVCSYSVLLERCLPNIPIVCRRYQHPIAHTHPTVLIVHLYHHACQIATVDPWETRDAKVVGSDGLAGYLCRGGGGEGGGGLRALPVDRVQTDGLDLGTLEKSKEQR